MKRVLLSFALALQTVGAAEPVPVAPGSRESQVAAWIRFPDAPEKYRGLPYEWLGVGDVRIVFEVAPGAGQALELLWGSKGDMRQAVLIVNGQRQELRAGEYDGFKWLRVPLPQGVEGKQWDVWLSRSGGRPAFVAELRLTTPEGDPQRPELKQTLYKARVVSLPLRPSASAGEAFPEMRKIWDREPGESGPPAAGRESRFRLAEKNGRLANEAFYRCRRFIDGWLKQADPETGLIPRNLGRDRDYWNGRDAGADNYPFMVLTASMTDRALLEGRMLEMLRTETRLTSRVGRLCDDYSFSRKGYRREEVNLDAIMFESAEYVKDGLIPITEWMGPSPWSERMTGLMEDIWLHAPVETPFGKIPSLNFEVCGDLLQGCSRIYWFTGDRRYLDWAIRLGDFYLLGDQHPTRDRDSLRLIDHGCEVVNGLTELYLAVAHAAPEKKRSYQAPLHEMFDRILEAGRNEHGMLYSSFNPKTGGNSGHICDTWGYNYDGFYTVYLLDGTEAYRQAVRHALENLKPHYTGFDWGGADGYADSLEGAINLINREPIQSAADWVDTEVRTMWAIQKPDGVIEGWHGDGNFARTTLMYALWKTAGVTVQPWRADVRFGAVLSGGTLYLDLMADEGWEGRVLFDRPRHRDYMHLPLDYPRINQFPEWFVAAPDQRFEVRAGDTVRTCTGKQLQEGLPARLKAGEEVRWTVRALGGR